MTTPRYAVNEDKVTVFETATGTAVCVCGPVGSANPTAWSNEQAQRLYASLIADLLNDAVQS